MASISRTGYSINSRSRDHVIISGRDFLGSLHAKAGEIAFCASPNPVTWPGTRISAAARGYANWKLIRLTIHYTTATTTTKSGTGVIGTVFGEQDVDPANYANLLTSNGGVQFQVWTNCSTNIDCSQFTQLRYYVSEQHGPESTPFRIYALTQGLDSGVDADYGSIFADYTYELSNPLVQETFPMALPGGAAQSITVVPTTTGNPIRLKSTIANLWEFVPAAAKSVADVLWWTAGNPLHLSPAAAPAEAPPSAASCGTSTSAANTDYYYSVSEAYDGEEMVAPSTLAVASTARGFFWFKGVKAAY